MRSVSGRISVSVLMKWRTCSTLLASLALYKACFAELVLEEAAAGLANEPRFVSQEHLQNLPAAHMAAPQLVASVLQGLKLAPSELAQLDVTEHAELIDAMRGAGVSLGDRFRVRRWISQEQGETRPVEPNIATERFEQQTHRTLQSEGGGGVSGDSIALMVTVLLGVGSFIVQAVTEKRAARAAEALQRELDRELAGRESERNIAAVQLDRCPADTREHSHFRLQRALFGVAVRPNRTFFDSDLDDDTQGAIADGGERPAFAVRGLHCKPEYVVLGDGAVLGVGRAGARRLWQ